MPVLCLGSAAVAGIQPYSTTCPWKVGLRLTLVVPLHLPFSYCSSLLMLQLAVSILSPSVSYPVVFSSHGVITHRRPVVLDAGNSHGLCSDHVYQDRYGRLIFCTDSKFSYETETSSDPPSRGPARTDIVRSNATIVRIQSQSQFQLAESIFAIDRCFGLLRISLVVEHYSSLEPCHRG